MADSPLQKYPFGLLGALDLKSTGDAPSVFGDRVQPTLDTLPFYGVRNAQWLRTTGAPATVGPFAQTGPAPTTYWWVQAISVRAVLDAADGGVDSQVYLTWYDGSPVRGVFLAERTHDGGSVPLSWRILTFQPAQPLIIQQGEFLFATVRATLTANAAVDLDVRAFVLPA